MRAHVAGSKESSRAREVVFSDYGAVHHAHAPSDRRASSTTTAASATTTVAAPGDATATPCAHDGPASHHLSSRSPRAGEHQSHVADGGDCGFAHE